MKNNRLTYLLIIILTIWLTILTFSQKQVETSNDNDKPIQYNVAGISTDFTKVIEENKSSIVTINADGKLSSGFVYKQIDDKVYIICSYHGIADAFNLNVLFSNSYSVHANLLDSNVYADVAVLEVSVPYELKQMQLANAFDLKAGEFVVAIGTPYSLDYVESVEMGMVSGLRMIENSITVSELTSNYYIDAIQLSSNISPGYSGSPLINMNGAVVGMNTMSLNSNFNFAISANELGIIADKIIAGEKANRYQLGIKGTYVSTMASYLKANLNLSVDTISGLYIEKVKENSVSHIAGIRSGDVVTKINDVEINTLDDYLNVLYTYTDVMNFEVIKDGYTYYYTVDISD